MEYCERCGPGLWDEPVNAFTNAAFLVAAWAVWLMARRTGSLTKDIWLLIGLAVSIGVGSGLWHTFASPWAEAMDRIPIMLFQLLFVWLYVRGVIRLEIDRSIALLVGFVAMSYLVTLLPPWFNRSIVYAPAFLLLVGLGTFHYRHCRHGRPLLLIASGVFLLALVFRSIDMIVCPYFPIGTHFMWHLLNGALVYLTTRALILNRSTPLPVDEGGGRQEC